MSQKYMFIRWISMPPHIRKQIERQDAVDEYQIECEINDEIADELIARGAETDTMRVAPDSYHTDLETFRTIVMRHALPVTAMCGSEDEKWKWLGWARIPKSLRSVS